jgi:hypothetical protein
LWIGFLIAALPYVIRMMHVHALPFFDAASVRSALLVTREVESLPRTVLTFLFAAIGSYAAWRNADDKVLGPLIAVSLASFLTLNQQLVHGRVISFSTHYMPFISFAAVLFIAWAATTIRTIRSSAWAAVFVCVVLLTPLIRDYGPRWNFFETNVPKAFAFQHLLPVINTLQSDGQKDTVLTDNLTALNIAVHTDDDVVFTEFLRHTLMSTDEYAARYCLSELPTVPSVDGSWVSERLQEFSRIGQVQIAETLRTNADIAKHACCMVRAVPDAFLTQFGVTKLLWNEVEHPEWAIDQTLFSKAEQGEGWSLWNVVAFDEASAAQMADASLACGKDR